VSKYVLFYIGVLNMPNVSFPLVEKMEQSTDSLLNTSNYDQLRELLLSGQPSNEVLNPVFSELNTCIQAEFQKAQARLISEASLAQNTEDQAAEQHDITEVNSERQRQADLESELAGLTEAIGLLNCQSETCDEIGKEQSSLQEELVRLQQAHPLLLTSPTVVDELIQVQQASILFQIETLNQKMDLARQWENAQARIEAIVCELSELDSSQSARVQRAAERQQRQGYAFNIPASRRQQLDEQIQKEIQGLKACYTDCRIWAEQNAYNMFLNRMGLALANKQALNVLSASERLALGAARDALINKVLPKLRQIKELRQALEAANSQNTEAVNDDSKKPNEEQTLESSQSDVATKNVQTHQAEILGLLILASVIFVTIVTVLATVSSLAFWPSLLLIYAALISGYLVIDLFVHLLNEYRQKTQSIVEVSSAQSLASDTVDALETDSNAPRTINNLERQLADLEIDFASDMNEVKAIKPDQFVQNEDNSVKGQQQSGYGFFSVPPTNNEVLGNYDHLNNGLYIDL
ncbi:MAG: hypothetical protein ACHP6H_04040, partial [Legionellales bacterium]